MRSVRTYVGILCLVGIISACSPKWYIWLINPTDISKVVFGIGSEERSGSAVELVQFEVLTCSEVAQAQRYYRYFGATRRKFEAVWRVKSESPVSLDSVVYGVLPAKGFVTVVPAKPLKPAGCYFAYLEAYAGRGWAAFRTDTLGRVRELGESEIMEMYEWWGKGG